MDIQSPPPAPTLNLQSNKFNLDDKISPSILLIIIILAIIFFVSGLLHLLFRFLLRQNPRDPDELESVTALQGQLQQLFHLHDAGVDQSYIDTLPIFQYKSVIGVKNPFDCAVCLCEFEPDDKLRLLPKCSHAFHMDCIDTWLLSHSTCPLCRATLLPDFNPCSPIVCVLASEGESSREIGGSSSNLESISHLGSPGEAEFGTTQIEFQRKSTKFEEKTNARMAEKGELDAKIVQVKLGKFRNIDGGESSSENNNLGSRRCFSMGSFAYVLDEETSLQVPIRTPIKKQSNKKRNAPLKPGHRAAMSEYGSDSRREFNTIFDTFKANEIKPTRNAIERTQKESFSISKIWLRGDQKNKKASLKSTSSFRFPMASREESGGATSCSGGGGGEVDGWEGDEETQSCYSVDSQANTSQSSTRKTLTWLMGRQNKVVHSSFSSNVQLFSV